MNRTDVKRRGGLYRRAASAIALLAVLGLASCGLSEDSEEPEPERATTTQAEVAPEKASAKRASGSGERKAKRGAARKGNALHLKRTKVGWWRLGPGFVKKGIPITVRIGDARKLNGGKLKGKVVVRAKTAQKLGLWPNPEKLKDRSVGKKTVKVKAGQKRTIVAYPHKRYRDEFRRAGAKTLRSGNYQIRAVLRDKSGRKVARIKKAVKVTNR